VAELDALPEMLIVTVVDLETPAVAMLNVANWAPLGRVIEPGALAIALFEE